MHVKPVATQSVHNQVSRLLDGQYKSDKPFRTLLLILQGQKNPLAIAAVLLSATIFASYVQLER